MSESSNWREYLLLNRDARTGSARADLARRASRGELVRVATGAYVPSGVWEQLGERDRHLTHVRVIAARARDPIVFSHASAAALWGLPWFGHWPSRVDVVRTEPARGQYAGGVNRHLPQGNVEPVEIDGIRVTPLARTVVDVARRREFLQAVVVGDAALNGARRSKLALPTGPITVGDLLDDAATGDYALTRARDTIGFMDGRSDSPGESISRVSMWRAGVPKPVLQQSFAPWTVDFWWPEHGVIGEFDGATKYLDAAMRGGRSAEQVVYDEKLREDELRRQVHGFARWTYADAVSPARLAARLRSAGLPVPNRTRFAAVAVV